MSRAIKILAVFLAISIVQPSVAETNLDVMVVFSDDSGLSSFEKAVVASRFQVDLAVVFGDPVLGLSGQLDGPHSITVWPLIAPEMSYNAANGSNAQALQWMSD